MLHRQRGAYNLYVVAILSMLLAAVAMVGLMSARNERNYFAEGLAKAGRLAGASPAGAALDSAKQAGASALGQGDGKLRKCVIDGKAVISNTECSEKNPTSKVIKIQDTKGFEAPRVPVEAPAALTSQPVLDKIIEKQLQ